MDPRAAPFVIDQVAQAVRTSALPSASEAAIPAWMIRVGSDDARVSLSVQREAMGDHGIVRGEGPPHRIVPRDGALHYVIDPRELRSNFLPVDSTAHGGSDDSHIARSAYPSNVRAATGCGNLLTNEGVVAIIRDGQFGIPSRHGIRTRSALLSEGGRTGLPIDLNSDEVAPPARPREDFPRPKTRDGFLISGPRLVTKGVITPADHDAFADLRHLLLPAYVELAPGLRVDFGFDDLYHDSSRRAAAIAGHPVSFPLEARLPHGYGANRNPLRLPIAPAALRRAFAEKGYVEADDASAPGTFSFKSDRVTVAFLEGIYPHHAIGVLPSGLIAALLVGGLSNRAGTTIQDLSAALVELGFRDAWLMDNGGDVALRLYGPSSDVRDLITPCESDRASTWRLRSAFLWHVD